GLSARTAAPERAQRRGVGGRAVAGTRRPDRSRLGLTGVSTKTVPLSDELHSYLLAHSTPPDPVVTDLIEETRTLHPDRVGLQIAPEQALFLTLFTRLLGVRRAVEVGTFTGLSSLSIALGMPPDGRLICFDVSEEYT